MTVNKGRSKYSSGYRSLVVRRSSFVARRSSLVPRPSSLAFLLILAILLLTPWLQNHAAAERFSARAAVEKTEVFVGEPFLFQIQVEGHEGPDKPDLSAVKDFSVQEQGGQSNSSSSVTIVNGRVTRNVKQGYIFSYQLSAKRTGVLSIPSIVVSAGGETVRTRPVNIKSVKPSETSDFKLRMELSSEKIYVGQPVTLTVTWYIGKDVEQFRFGMPVLTDSRFHIADVDIPMDPNRKDRYLGIPLEGGEVIGEKTQGTLDGKKYLTLRFQKALIPKTPGRIVIPGTTVVFNAVVGRQNRAQSRDPFDSFFSFRSRNRAIHQKFVVPSNEPELTVLDLPESGRPAGFTGLVGSYNLAADAAPTEVNVGDPITLTIDVTGPDYLENVELPPLHLQTALARDFKIPTEMAPGKIKGTVKTFTQTVRAKHPDVRAIPSIELPYFDAESGKYAVARTEPIPLSVKATRVVTAEDAEGRAVVEERKTELQTWTAGISHNYEDLSILTNQSRGFDLRSRSLLWKILVGLPPLLYFILFVSKLFVSWRRSDPKGRQSQRAYGELRKRLKKIRDNSEDLNQAHIHGLEALKEFLGSKLDLSSGAITFNDVRGILRERGVDGDTLEEMKKLFEEGEARRFAGSTASHEGPSSFVDRAEAVAGNIDRSAR